MGDEEKMRVRPHPNPLPGGEGTQVGEVVVFEGGVFEASMMEPDAKTGGKRVEVTIIKPGLSNNRMEYPEEVLRESVPMWNGVAAFCDHPSHVDMSRAGGRSVRDLVGVYSDARWDNGVKATLRFNGQAGWLYDMVCEAMQDRESGKHVPMMGISGDMQVLRERMMDRFKVHRIMEIRSADVVYRPSAGGKFERVLEGGNGGTMYEEEGTTKHTNDTKAGGGAPGAVETLHATSVTHAASVREAVEAELAAVREARIAVCGVLLDQKLAGAALPEKAQAQLRGRFSGRAFEGTELDAEIAGMKELLASVVQGQVVEGMGTGRLDVRIGKTPRQKVEMALERLFGLPVEDTTVPRLSGIREAYILITGDREFTGRYYWEQSIVREADEVTTSILNSVVANVMNKRLVADYKGQEFWWKSFCTRTSLKDMKLQTRILLNDFAALATVNENGTYVNLAWGDNAETYTPTKRGNIVYVTLEAIMNDDVRAITRIPSKLAVSAAVTLNEFVSALFTTGAGLGPNMADGVAVFNGAHGANTSANALSSANLQTAITAVMKHANSASKRLGIRPKFLLLPPDLLWTARTIVESGGLPGTANNDVNVTRGVAEIVVVPNWTDVNNWYLMPDPAVAETIELGFLNGREEPELLMQDNPDTGTVFTNDAISYKVRHIYGGGWLDYRGTYGAVVA